MAIHVTNQIVVDEHQRQIEPAEWRVAVDSHEEGELLAIAMVFGREQDAERAREALERAGLCDKDRLLQAGESVVRGTMLNSLAW